MVKKIIGGEMVTPASQETKAAFRVSVEPMQASNGLTHYVCLDRGDRPLEAYPWDKGRITPVNRNLVHEANHAGKEWADFLGVDFTPCKEHVNTASINAVPQYGI